ncbi:hypothetical protein B9G69_002490 [Bdellovibrio sp. SKB1291214]|uniref:hypothetical protein n=1 Tax=Bdellovibrio sp. SKB1291214 TaxID=1732569 RepID=UPI000B516DE6|nr:hypothetical protein [Bdellovibrio sp. SKB1291214]UYL09441.1 hypothetical protein B9G69_002490 [Bdellovibrio sp. SKB1291214]
MKRLMMAALLPVIVAGCTNSNNNSQSPLAPGSERAIKVSANALTVTSLDGVALAGAQVLIGDALNFPFEGNFLTTDANGQVEIPASWTEAQPVTIQAKGYVRQTYMSVQPGAVSFKLRPLNTVSQFEIKGQATGLPIKNGDGNIDFGLVMQGFSKMQLFAFNMDSVLSAQNDKISAIGQEMDIPANLSLPQQKEKYALFTVTLDKPAYRIYFGQPGVTRVFVAKGTFPFKTIVDGVRGGAKLYEMLNVFNLTGGAVRDVNLSKGRTDLDLPTNEIAFSVKNTVVAPQFRADETFMAAGLSGQGGFLLPTDVKKLNAGQKITLNTAPNMEANVLAVLTKTEDLRANIDRVSTAILPMNGTTAPQVLPLINNPIIGAGGLEIAMPSFQTVAGVNPLATYAVFSNEIQVQMGADKVKLMNQTWEVYADKWVASMKVPTFPNDTLMTGVKRWEVNFLGSQTASQAPMGAAMIEAATHVTHSSVNF